VRCKIEEERKADPETVLKVALGEEGPVVTDQGGRVVTDQDVHFVKPGVIPGVVMVPGAALDKGGEQDCLFEMIGRLAAEVELMLVV